MKILVTGGAGYIGSHVVRQLGERNDNIVVYDNLTSGYEQAVLYGDLIRADLDDIETLESVFREHEFDAVLHFAAHISVAESVANPLKYYVNNTLNTIRLLDVCNRHGVKNFIFSSTAAVYSTSNQCPITENADIAPASPYGHSKWMSEQVLADAAASTSLHYVSLRYFNAAGADPEGRIGECHDPETHLIPLALQVASGRKAQLDLYGRDYPTPDGTCVRDYIHIEDLAKAHLRALDYLVEGGKSAVLNCGYGHGFSVLEVIEAVRRITGHPIPVSEADRRQGDTAELVAESSLIRQKLNWEPEYDDLDLIISHAWAWEQKLASRHAFNLSTTT